MLQKAKLHILFLTQILRLSASDLSHFSLLQLILTEMHTNHYESFLSNYELI